MCVPAFEHYQTTGKEILNPIPVLHKVWSHIGIDLIGPLKEIDGYKYIVTDVDCRSLLRQSL